MSNGQFPVILAGTTITASLLQSFAPLYALKLGDTARASNATLAADPDLVLSLAANAQYQVTGYLVYNGGVNGSSDMQVQLTAPTGASTFSFELQGKDASTLAPVLGSASTSGNVSLGTAGTGSLRAADLKATVVTSSSAGSLSLKWAQVTSNSTATTMKAGSWLLAVRTG